MNGVVKLVKKLTNDSVVVMLAELLRHHFRLELTLESCQVYAVGKYCELKPFAVIFRITKFFMFSVTQGFRSLQICMYRKPVCCYVSVNIALNSVDS